MVRSACTHGETERHRLQRPGFVTRNLESLHLRCEVDAAVADRMSCATAAVGQQVADSAARTNQIDGAQQRIAVAELQPWLVQPSALHALHCKGDRAAGADGVQAKLVAS